MKHFALILLASSMAMAACNGGNNSSSTTNTDSTLATSSGKLTPDEARAIAREAYTYGYPLVDGYRIQHAYFV